jgi:hypothetical protein
MKEEKGNKVILGNQDWTNVDLTFIKFECFIMEDKAPNRTPIKKSKEKKLKS